MAEYQKPKEEPKIEVRPASQVVGECKSCNSTSFEVEITKMEEFNDLVLIVCAKCGTAG